MSLFRTVAAAFSMFSAVPVPHVKWDEGSMRYMICAFPLVGAVIGAALLAWIWLTAALGLGKILFAAGLTVIPIAINGGIHLDGFCDTADALASHAGPERRREILKDPHTGAFAVIAVCAYLLLYFALAAELPQTLEAGAAIGLGCILSRTLSGISVTCFPMSSGKGLLAFFREQSAKKKAAGLLIAEALLCAASMAVLFPVYGAVMILAAAVCLIYLRRMSERKFEGMSGDLAGWFLQTSELTMLGAYILIYRVVQT